MRRLRRKKKRSTYSDVVLFLVPACLVLTVLIGSGIVFVISMTVLQGPDNDNARHRRFVLSPHAAVFGKTRSAGTAASPPKKDALAVPTTRLRRGDAGVDHSATSQHQQHQSTPKVPILLSKQALEMCTRTLFHTLETTTIVLPNAETFIHTGDIDDLWLRDSAAQIHPLLIPVIPNTDDDSNSDNKMVSLIYNDVKLDRIVAGLIARHAMYIRHDPYANAFRIDDSYVFSEAQKRMGRHDLISTWNYELDSACYTIRLLYFYWTQSRNPIPALTNNPAVQEAVSIMVDLWIAEQQHELDNFPMGPLFDCLNCGKPYRYPGLARQGKGTPTNASAGLTWTGFRPSDDECQHGYLIPANMFTVTVLQYVQEMNRELWNNDTVLAEKAARLSADIQRGIEEHAIIQHDTYGRIYAYEVDGLGNYVLMDDANVPSLLSIPYLEYPFLDETVYANTRKFILSKDNLYFAQGTNSLTGSVAGVGSPHMKSRIRNNIWPMGMAVQGLTTTNTTEAVHIVEQLVQASAGTGWMHESFDANRPSKFTRSWFCWSDSLYAELVLRLLNDTESSAGVATTQRCLDPEHKYKVLEWRDPVTVTGGMYAAD